MSWKRFIRPAIFFVGSVALAVAFFPQIVDVNPSLPNATEVSSTDRRFMTVYIAGRPFELEISETASEIQQGLSDRDEVSADGMIFVLPIRSTPRFWMKNMRFDLDFVWVDRGRVVGIVEQVKAPPPETPDSMLDVVSPSGMVSHVIELPAGTIQREGLQIGDAVEF